jgi:hypothetical protein
MHFPNIFVHTRRMAKLLLSLLDVDVMNTLNKEAQIEGVWMEMLN